MSKNVKKLQSLDPMQEFYSVLDEIRDMFENQGYKKQKTLYLAMKEKHNWSMSYSTFTRHFKKEIKSKEDKKSEPVQKQTKEPADEKREIDPSREEELRRRLTEDLADDRYEQAEQIAKRLREKNPELFT